MEKLIKHANGQWSLGSEDELSKAQWSKEAPYTYHYVGNLGEEGGHTYSIHKTNPTSKGKGDTKVGVIHHVGSDEQGGWFHPAIPESHHDTLHNTVKTIHSNRTPSEH